MIVVSAASLFSFLIAQERYKPLFAAFLAYSELQVLEVSLLSMRRFIASHLGLGVLCLNHISHSFRNVTCLQILCDVNC